MNEEEEARGAPRAFPAKQAEKRSYSVAETLSFRLAEYL